MRFVVDLDALRGLSKSQVPMGYAGGLHVIAIGPHGGKIVGYKHGDLKHPIYAGSAQAKKLAGGKKEGFGTFGIGELLESLVHHFGLKATQSGHYIQVDGPHDAVHAAVATFGGAGLTWSNTLKVGDFSSTVANIDPSKPITEHGTQVKGGDKPVLVAKGGGAPDGWPKDLPAPGARFKRHVDGHTYLLTVAREGGKPRFLVTAPGDSPLFLFTGGGEGMVTGTVGGEGQPVTVSFDNATAAAVACLGAKVKNDALIKKSTNGHAWWGWGGASPTITEHSTAGAEVAVVSLASAIDAETAFAQGHGQAWDTPGQAPAVTVADPAPAAPPTAPEPPAAPPEPEPVAVDAPQTPNDAWKDAPSEPDNADQAAMAAWLATAPPGATYATVEDKFTYSPAAGGWVSEELGDISTHKALAQQIAHEHAKYSDVGTKWTLPSGDVVEKVGDNKWKHPVGLTSDGGVAELGAKPVPPGAKPSIQAAWIASMPKKLTKDALIDWFSSALHGAKITLADGNYTMDSSILAWVPDGSDDPSEDSLSAVQMANKMLGESAPQPAPAVAPSAPHASGWDAWKSAHPEWKYPHPPGTVASKTAGKLSKAPLNAGKPVQATLLESGELEVHWPEGGGNYTKIGGHLGALEPGTKIKFPNPTAAAQAVVGTAQNGNIFWGLKPGSSGKLDATITLPGAAGAPEPSANPWPDPDTDEPGSGIDPFAAEDKESAEATWEHATKVAGAPIPMPSETSPLAWVLAAPPNSVITISNHVAFVKDKTGNWASPDGESVSPEDVAAHIGDSEDEGGFIEGTVAAPATPPAPAGPDASWDLAQLKAWAKEAPSGSTFDAFSTFGNHWTKKAGQWFNELGTPVTDTFAAKIFLAVHGKKSSLSDALAVMNAPDVAPSPALPPLDIHPAAYQFAVSVAGEKDTDLYPTSPPPGSVYKLAGGMLAIMTGKKWALFDELGNKLGEHLMYKKFVEAGHLSFASFKALTAAIKAGGPYVKGAEPMVHDGNGATLLVPPGPASTATKASGWDAWTGSLHNWPLKHELEAWLGKAPTGTTFGGGPGGSGLVKTPSGWDGSGLVLSNASVATAAMVDASMIKVIGQNAGQAIVAKFHPPGWQQAAEAAEPAATPKASVGGDPAWPDWAPAPGTIVKLFGDINVEVSKGPHGPAFHVTDPGGQNVMLHTLEDVAEHVGYDIGYVKKKLGIGASYDKAHTLPKAPAKTSHADLHDTLFDEDLAAPAPPEPDPEMEPELEPDPIDVPTSGVFSWVGGLDHGSAIVIGGNSWSKQVGGWAPSGSTPGKAMNPTDMALAVIDAHGHGIAVKAYEAGTYIPAANAPEPGADEPPSGDITASVSWVVNAKPGTKLDIGGLVYTKQSDEQWKDGEGYHHDAAWVGQMVTKGKAKLPGDPEPAPSVPAPGAAPAPKAKPKKEHDWDGWISKGAKAKNKGKWLTAAPPGSAIPLEAGGHAWKAKDGSWHDATGNHVDKDAVTAGAAHAGVAGVKAAKGLGPDGKTYPLGTHFSFATVQTTSGDVLKAKIAEKYPSATVVENPTHAAKVGNGPWWTIQIPTSEIAGKTKEQLHEELAPSLKAAGLNHYTPAVSHIGGTWAYANVKGDLGKIVSEEKTTVAHAPAAVGSNHEDLHDAALLAGPLPFLGHGIDAGGDAVRDQYVRVLKRKGGKKEIQFKLTGWTIPGVQAKLKNGLDGTWKIGHGSYDKKSGESTDPAAVEVHNTLTTKVIKGQGWTAHVASDDNPWTHHGSVKIDVEPGTTPATALAGLGKVLGLPLADPPSDEAAENYKLAKMLWSVSPSDHNAIIGLVAEKKPDWGKVRAALLKNGVTAADIAKAGVFTPTHGHRSINFRDGQKLVDKGLIGFRHNWYSSDVADLADKLASSGNVSTAARWKSGTGGGGYSAGQDEEKGGADYVFNYLVKPSSDNPFVGHHASNALTIMSGVETLERGDWHAADDDNYGSTLKENTAFKHRAGRYDLAIKLKGEYMVQHSVGLDEVRAIIVGDAAGLTASARRAKLIDEFKKRGVSSIAGRPIEQVVVTSFEAAKKNALDTWKQTKKERGES